VAAGVDKDASWFEDLGALGFGFVEVGTITALAQEGNPRPRVHRLLADRAIVNRMGFPNPGADAAARTLAERRAAAPGDGTVVGVNVGKSRVVAVEDAAADYRKTVERLAPVSDYLVLNVSSPNTPGLRRLQEGERLRELIDEVRQATAASGRRVPLLVKIDPDLPDESIAEIVALAVERGLDGIVAVNTTLDRGSLTPAGLSIAAAEAGGISGPPLRSRSLEVLRLIRKLAGDKLVVISVGGVASVEDVWERVCAGATLVQVYTALVYAGPGWPRRVNRELARRVRAAGLSSVQDVRPAAAADALLTGARPGSGPQA
jgi:dihydroorotate dehydrogenase